MGKGRWTQRFTGALIALLDPQHPDEVHPVLLWLRTVGAIGVLLGVCGMIFTTLFWPATAIFYLAILLVILDAWLEPRLKGRVVWKTLITLVVMVFAGMFSWKVIFVPAPLSIFAMVEYQDAYIVSPDAHWNPAWQKATISFANDTDLDYERINILLKPELAIARIDQGTTLPNVDFQEASGLLPPVVSVIPSSGPNKGEILNLGLHKVASSLGYYVHCDRLPAHSHLDVVIALAAIRPPDRASTFTPLDKRWYNVLTSKATGTEAGSVWLGHDDADIFVRPGKARSIAFRGSYHAAWRDRRIDSSTNFSGYFSVGKNGVPSLN